ncbi:MAG: cobalamin B12-binding domain-containing protein, partial [Candidatus Hydrogenedentes bacterium]|nr:cobalamin B12-binding domain-containing protein [Candidatus Hydrogenedentota bacterium]
GYRVIDLGTMVPLQQYIDTAKEHHAHAIGMSALLVQTSNHMITVSRMMQEQDLDIPVLIGGAPVSDRHAAYVAMAGHDDRAAIRSDVFYCRTAMDGVNIMNKLRSGEDLGALLQRNKEKLLRKLDHAEKKAAEEQELLATLPRRKVVMNGFRLPEAPRFARQRYQYTLREFVSHIDKKTLFSLNWRFGTSSARARTGHTSEELEALFEKWVERATKYEWIRPQGVAGIFPCQAEGDVIVVYDPHDLSREIARFDFTVVIGAGRQDLVSGAQYFHSRASGAMSACGIQLTTSGPQVDAVLADIKASGDSESHLFLQGLSDRIAEDMAEHLNNEQRRLLGLDPGQGQRWSPGYPGMRNIELNKTIHELLAGAELLGVHLTSAGEFSPTGTTGAVVSYHPEARYT